MRRSNPCLNAGGLDGIAAFVGDGGVIILQYDWVI